MPIPYPPADSILGLISITRRVACADTESFVRGGPNLITVFYDGIEDPNITINGGPTLLLVW